MPRTTTGASAATPVHYRESSISTEPIEMSLVGRLEGNFYPGGSNCDTGNVGALWPYCPAQCELLLLAVAVVLSKTK